MFSVSSVAATVGEALRRHRQFRNSTASASSQKVRRAF